MANTLHDQLRTSLGAAYTIDRELGGGGMSRVFVAPDTALGRTVVIKAEALQWAGRQAEALEQSFTARALMNWDSPWLRLLRDDPRYVALRKAALATTFKS